MYLRKYRHFVHLFVCIHVSIDTWGYFKLLACSEPFLNLFPSYVHRTCTTTNRHSIFCYLVKISTDRQAVCLKLIKNRSYAKLDPLFTSWDRMIETNRTNLVPRVSHLTAGGGKMRDPGNEVLTTCLHNEFIVLCLVISIIFCASLILTIFVVSKLFLCKRIRIRDLFDRKK